MNTFKNFDILELDANPFKLIGKDWMLITAGDTNNYNTMTASWGAFGVLWKKNTATIYVRPTRHTFSFLENNKYYTLSFFEEKHRKALEFCGANSGKDTDKAAKTGLTPFPTNKSTAFQEARLIIECEKLYFADLLPSNFLDTNIDSSNYPKKDYHRMYIGEVLSCLKNT